MATHYDLKPCPRCNGPLRIDPSYNPVLAVCEHCAYFERIPGRYTPDASHTARLIKDHRHDK